MSFENAPNKSPTLRHLVVGLALEFVPGDDTQSEHDNTQQNLGAQKLLSDMLQLPDVGWDAPNDSDRPIVPVSSNVRELYDVLGEMIKRSNNG